MIILCKECGTPLTGSLEELKELNKLNPEDRCNYIPKGFYFVGNDFIRPESKKKILVNHGDLLNAQDHPEQRRLNGCCGPDGSNGLNRVCTNGHEIATAIEDCWMPHYIAFESENVFVDL